MLSPRQETLDQRAHNQHLTRLQALPFPGPTRDELKFCLTAYRGLLRGGPMNEAGDQDGSLVHARRLRGGRKRVLTSLAFAAAIPVLLLSGWIAYFIAQQQRDLAGKR